MAGALRSFVKNVVGHFPLFLLLITLKFSISIHRVLAFIPACVLPQVKSYQDVFLFYRS